MYMFSKPLSALIYSGSAPVMVTYVQERLPVKIMIEKQ